MGPQYGFKLEMCSYLDPLPADPLAAFADWTITHYGVRVSGRAWPRLRAACDHVPCAPPQANYSSSCYYNTACLADPGRIAQWYNVKPWIWQCCSEGEWSSR